MQFKKMLDAMKESQDLKAAARAHEGFMAACIIQSCLDVPIFSRLLSKILVICRAFCGYLKVSLRPGCCRRLDSMTLSSKHVADVTSAPAKRLVMSNPLPGRQTALTNYTQTWHHSPALFDLAGQSTDPRMNISVPLCAKGLVTFRPIMPAEFSKRSERTRRKSRPTC